MRSLLRAEGALICPCGSRDSAAFATLYEEHVDRVYRHAYYLLGSKTEAEDLTAQTFLQAWAAVDRYQDRGKPVLSWLLTIAHNLVVSRRRNGHHESRLHENIAASGRFVSPEEALIAKSREEEVTRAILKLKPLERQVILLRFVDNVEYAEVAQILGKSVNAVRVIQYRALCNLRRLVGTRGKDSI